MLYTPCQRAFACQFRPGSIPSCRACARGGRTVDRGLCRYVGRAGITCDTVIKSHTQNTRKVGRQAEGRDGKSRTLVSVRPSVSCCSALWQIMHGLGCGGACCGVGMARIVRDVSGSLGEDGVGALVDASCGVIGWFHVIVTPMFRC